MHTWKVTIPPSPWVTTSRDPLTPRPSQSSQRVGKGLRVPRGSSGFPNKKIMGLGGGMGGWLRATEEERVDICRDLVWARQALGWPQHTADPVRPGEV